MSSQRAEKVRFLWFIAPPAAGRKRNCGGASPLADPPAAAQAAPTRDDPDGGLISARDLGRAKAAAHCESGPPGQRQRFQEAISPNCRGMG